MKRVKFHESTDFKYYFTVTARNGQVLVTSETYDKPQSMIKGINALIKVLMPLSGGKFAIDKIGIITFKKYIQ